MRAIDAYVNTLDLQDSGFKYCEVITTSGQPPYHPAALLKLYLYGYLQGIRSSRKLERETHRNLEVMWLVEGLLPTYKTIVNFRKDNGVALKAVNRDFLLLCKELSLFGGESVAVDGRFFNALEIKACEDQNIKVYVPVPKYSSLAERQGRYRVKDFAYDEEKNHYTCPQGNKLQPSKNFQKKDGKTMLRYRSKTADCRDCPLRQHCLTTQSKTREIFRWEHQKVIDEHKKRMKACPKIMKKRSALVEHPFGTLKHRAGMNHFLMRGLDKCRGEFSLMVLGYHFTRVINLKGVDFLRDYWVQKAENKLKSVKYA